MLVPPGSAGLLLTPLDINVQWQYAGIDGRRLKDARIGQETGASTMAERLSTLNLAERMSRLGTESAFEVLVRARELEASGKEIIHLEIGEPDFPTAPHIVEAAAKALRDGWTHYGPPAGLPQLREAIAEDVEHAARHPQSIRREVVVTPGGKPIMFFTILALMERDDEVLYPNPGFPIYESMMRFVGGRAGSLRAARGPRFRCGRQRNPHQDHATARG